MPPTAGRIFIRDQELNLSDYSVRMAHDLSIETVYQDKSLAEKQPLWRNFFVGRQITNRFGFIDIKREKEVANQILMDVIGFRGVGITVDSTIGNLSGGERQGIAIGRAMHYNADLIILDEPTAALGVAEVRKVIDFVRRIKDLRPRLHLYRAQPRPRPRGRRPAGRARPRRDRQRDPAEGHVGDRTHRISHRPTAQDLRRPSVMAQQRASLIFRRIEGLPIIIVFALILACLFMFTAPEVFLQPFIYTTFLSTLPPVILLAIGLTFVIGAGEIDLCFPAIIGFSGFVFAVIFKCSRIFTTSAGLAVLAGSFSGWASSSPSLQASSSASSTGFIASVGIPSFIATLGTQFFWFGMATVLSGGKSYALRGAEETHVWRWVVGRPFGDPTGFAWVHQISIQAIWTALVAVFLWFILNRHRFGEHVLFIGDSNDVSRVVGIDVDREKIKLFTLMGALAGCAAIILTLENKNYFGNQGQGYLLIAIASVLIGGTSIFGGRATIIGTIFGCFIIAMVEPGLVATGLTGAWVHTVRGLIFLISIIFYLYVEEPQRRATLFSRGSSDVRIPAGCFGRKRSRQLARGPSARGPD